MGLFGGKKNGSPEVQEAIVRQSGCSDIQSAIELADRYGIPLNSLGSSLTDIADFVATSPDVVQSSSGWFKR